jgi:hypothetical protein
VLAELVNGLVLATTRCLCDYLEEVSGFEEVAIRMKLLSMTQSRLILEFEYWRGESLVARKRATVASMRRENGTMIPSPPPSSAKLWKGIGSRRGESSRKRYPLQRDNGRADGPFADRNEREERDRLVAARR